MEQFFSMLPTLSGAVLIFILVLVVFQEAVNGFHDVANAVATVIYARAMPPISAVAMAAFFNFLGVTIGGTAVAFSLVYMLPREMVAGINTIHEASLFLAMIVTAVGWNFATWWLGIPNSTTHTYIGSIIGIAMAHAVLVGKPVADQINWHQGEKILITLLVSPIVGFVLGVMLLYLVRWLVKNPDMYKPAGANTRPPPPVRGTLIAGAAGVSLLHGSNDGQKSIGLMMIVLFGLFPATYGLDPDRLTEIDFPKLLRVADQVKEVARDFTAHPLVHQQAQRGLEEAEDLANALVAKKQKVVLSEETAIRVRLEILDLHDGIGRMLKDSASLGLLRPDQREKLTDAYEFLGDFIEYVPLWVMMLSAIALGGGTMIGYKKIVTTLGEKMGSSRMDPAQGTAAQLSAVASIALADFGGMPVSTTHVLSSAVVGTVVASPGQLVNRATLTSILLTWFTTLPGTVMLSFAVGIVFHAALV